MEPQYYSLQGDKLHTIPIDVWSRCSTARRSKTPKPVNRNRGPSVPKRNRRKRLTRARKTQGHGQLAQIPKGDKGMERYEGHVTGARCRPATRAPTSWRPSVSDHITYQICRAECWRILGLQKTFTIFSHEL
jgi:hypothetical protein